MVQLVSGTVGIHYNWCRDNLGDRGGVDLGGGNLAMEACDARRQSVRCTNVRVCQHL